jgi:hypothetical protein
MVVKPGSGKNNREKILPELFFLMIIDRFSVGFYFFRLPKKTMLSDTVNRKYSTNL